MRVSIVAVLLAVAAVAAAQGTPGFRVQLTNAGLDYARKIGVPILEKMIQTLTIPDISGSAHTPVGSVDFTLSNIHATSISLPESSIKCDTTGVSLSIGNVDAKLNADWKYREHHWPHVSDHGSVDIEASSISLSLTISTGLSPSNEPTVSTASCSGDIGKLDVHFHGGASWLYNLFDDLIEKEIKKSLNSQLCAQISKVIDDEVNKELATLPQKEPLDEYAGIDFELVEAPKTSDNYLLTSHLGQFYQAKNPSAKVPFAPSTMPYPTEWSRMFYFYISAYTVETAGWAYAASGRLNYTITAEDVPSSFPIQLNTKSFGALIPELEKKYPGMPMEITLEPRLVPVSVDATPTGVNATIYLDMYTYVIPNKTSKVQVFILNTTVTAAATVWVANVNGTEFVQGNLTFLELGLDASNSTVGKINVNGLDAIINAFVETYLLPGLNKHLTKGFPLPIIDDVSFVNPEVRFAQGFVYIGTDVTYTPSTKAKRPVQQ